MKRAITAVALATLLLCAQSGVAGARPLTRTEKERAVERVVATWEPCLNLAGTTAHGATVRRTNAKETLRPIDAKREGHRPVMVTLTTGEQFIVHLKPGLKGAAVHNIAAGDTLDRAAAAGGDC